MLQIHIDDFPVLVDGPPKVVLLTGYSDEHFIQKVRVTKSRVSTPKTSGKFRAKFVDPKSNGLVADRNIAFREKVLYIADAEIEAEVEPNGMLDDRRWESMTLVDVVHLDMLPEGQLICQYPAEELHVTPAAISHQAKRLEAYLSVQLFRRLPRGLLLTETGQTLLSELREVFLRLDTAMAT